MAEGKRRGMKVVAGMDSAENETAIADAADAASGDAVKIMLTKNLIQAVIEASGLKRNAVKPVVEAVLAELGKALARGEALNVPPLGKLSVNRSKEVGNADVMILKLRRIRPGAAPAATGAAADDEGEAEGDD
jgi:hypothetical protein